MSALDAVWNLGLKATRRLSSAHKPLVRFMRRSARDQEHEGYRREVVQLDREIKSRVAGDEPIIAGPWLAEVGYEVLYWIPFLRWLQDAYGIPQDRLNVISRGGMEAAYIGIAGGYVDLFDISTLQSLTARNNQRRADHEGGGQKQSAASRLDEELIASARNRLGLASACVVHPSLMFRLFRNVWHGNLPMDVLWRHTRYLKTTLDGSQTFGGMPTDFIAVKLYNGPALTRTEVSSESMRALVAQAASIAPVVSLDADFGIDEHRDFDLGGISGVTSARGLMSPRNNLAVQLALIARSRFLLGTCGGLAWMAPFLGVPTVAVYDNDRILASHLLVARQAGALASAAEFAPLDLRALSRAGVLSALAGAASMPRLE